MSCGAKMRLVRVEPAETMMVIGFEYRTFECSSCQEVERRLIFTREPTPVPVDTASSVSLTSLGQNEAAPPESPASPDEGEAAPSASPSFTGQNEPTAEPLVTDKQRSEAYRSWADLPRHRDLSRLPHSPLSKAPTPQAPRQSDFVNLKSHEDPVQPVAPPSVWARAIAKLRGRQHRGPQGHGLLRRRDERSN
jgi:hypothetical protein